MCQLLCPCRREMAPSLPAALLPEGQRPVVLFRHVEGRRPEAGASTDARAQGVTLARIHAAAEDYAGAKACRYRLDLDHLLHRQMAAVLDVKTLDDRDTGTSDGACVTPLSFGCRRIRLELDVLPRRLSWKQRTHRNGGAACGTGYLLRFRRRRPWLPGLRPRSVSLGKRLLSAPKVCNVARLHRGLPFHSLDHED